jgi:hypothetical protein
MLLLLLLLLLLHYVVAVSFDLCMELDAGYVQMQSSGAE